MKELEKKDYIEIEPIKIGSDQEEDSAKIVQLQLTMATSSINHEYARLELDDTADADRCEELMEYMNACRQKYFEARKSLEVYDPYAVEEFERDLIQQKRETLSVYNA